MMVGAHPEVSAPLSVTGLWYDTEGRLDAYNGLAERFDIERLIDDLCAHERIRLWKTEFNRDALANRIRPRVYADVICAFHEAQAEAEEKRIWAKTES